MSPQHQPAPLRRHSWAEDITGLGFGIVMTAFGAVLLKSAGLITGQIAGLSILLSHLTHLPFGLCFFGLNLPFYAFGLKRKGWKFTLRTIVAVALIASLMQILPYGFRFEMIVPWVAAILAGLCCGVGLISLFRHGASSGGIGIVAVIVQEKTGFRAGWLQLAFDAFVFGAGAVVLNPTALAASLLGAAIVNLLIAVNHRNDLYVGVTA